MEREENYFWGVWQTQENYTAFYSKVVQYFEDERLTDVCITCRDAREFKCHRLVLAAASDYFEAMFTGNWEEKREGNVALFDDIDSATFELVIQFAYKGCVAVNSENVYNLLTVSDRLGMMILEKICLRYLTEREIPMKYALDIFAFACATEKKSLISGVGRSILHHLDHFQRNEGGLVSVTLDELKRLLTFWPPSSWKRERFLFSVLIHWVSHSVLSQQDQESFAYIVRTFPFEHISKGFIARIFPENGAIDLQAVPEWILAGQSSTSQKLSLHMYVRSSNSCDLFTLKTYKNVIDWYPPTRISDVADEMKLVAVDDRLYSYSLQQGSGDGKLVAFSVYSSASLADKQSLRVPTDLLENPFKEYDSGQFDAVNICSDPITSRIYLQHHFTSQYMTTNLFSYNCEIDTWFPINCSNGNLKVSTITCLDSRLYVIALDNKVVQAYDHRAGKWETLANTEWCHGKDDKSCCHKGKIYVSGEMERFVELGAYQVMLEAYDPVAERWSTIAPAQEQPISALGWLVSFENKLWVLGQSDENEYFTPDEYHYYVQSYDSFLQRWDVEYSLFEEKRKRIIGVSVF